MFDIFTDAAKRAIALAQDEAVMLSHDCITAEHLLLGLTGVGDGLAAEVLAEHGVTVERARSQTVDLLAADGMTASSAEPVAALATIAIDVDDIRRRADETFGRGKFIFPRPRFTSGAKRVIEGAVSEAQALGHDNVGTEHMLLGLLAEGDGFGIRALRALGVDPAALRTLVLARIGR